MSVLGGHRGLSKMRVTKFPRASLSDGATHPYRLLDDWHSGIQCLHQIEALLNRGRPWLDRPFISRRERLALFPGLHRVNLQENLPPSQESRATSTPGIWFHVFCQEPRHALSLPTSLGDNVNRDELPSRCGEPPDHVPRLIAMKRGTKALLVASLLGRRMEHGARQDRDRSRGERCKRVGCIRIRMSCWRAGWAGPGEPLNRLSMDTYSALPPCRTYRGTIVIHLVLPSRHTTAPTSPSALQDT